MFADRPTPARDDERPLSPYTLGSTGKPKGVRRLGGSKASTLRDRAWSRVRTEMLQLNPGSRFSLPPRSYHSAPSTLTSAALVPPAWRLFVAPQSSIAESFLATIEKQRITHIYLVPTHG